VREEDADGGLLGDGEVAQRDVERGELTRQVAGVHAHVRDPRVHAFPVGLGARLEVGGEGGPHPLELRRRVVVAPGDQVVVEVAAAEDLGEPAGGRAPEQLELEEAVLRDRVTGAPPAVLHRRAGDGRHAGRVAHDPHAGPRLLGLAGKVAGLWRNSMNGWVWSDRCGDPLPDATPGSDTNPLWPGGRMVSAWMTRAAAADGRASSAASVRSRSRMGSGNVTPAIFWRAGIA